MTIFNGPSELLNTTRLVGSSPQKANRWSIRIRHINSLLSSFCALCFFAVIVSRPKLSCDVKWAQLLTKRFLRNCAN
jgi:hypothetical protein